MIKRIGAWVLTFVIVLLVIMFFNVIWHWVEVKTGTINTAGPYYGFWSGFGSDIGEAVLITGLYRYFNCHSPTCHRIGLYHAAGGQYKFCRHHHPDLAGSKPTLELMHKHHAQHIAVSRSPEREPVNPPTSDGVDPLRVTVVGSEQDE